MTNDELSPGHWLKVARERGGYPVAARFAEALGIKPPVLSTYERDKVKVPDDLSERIARVLRRDIIEVRRGLGLWVPPGDNRGATAVSLDDYSDAELLAELTRRAEARLQPAAEVDQEIA